MSGIAAASVNPAGVLNIEHDARHLSREAVEQAVLKLEQVRSRRVPQEGRRWFGPTVFKPALVAVTLTVRYPSR